MDKQKYSIRVALVYVSDPNNNPNREVCLLKGAYRFCSTTKVQ